MKKFIYIFLFIIKFGFSQGNSMLFDSYKSQAHVVLNDSMVSAYNFDFTANDTLGVNNGSMQNGATYTVGLIGGAGKFDGINDYFKLASQKFNLTKLSVSMWIKSGNWSTDPGLLANYTYNGSYYGWAIAMTANKPYFLIGHTTTETSISANTLSLNTWHHIAITYDNTVFKMYVDGTLDNSKTFTSNMTYTVNTDFTQIGSLVGGSSAFLNGDVDAVQVWRNYILSSTEITYLYNSAAGRQAPF